MIIGDA